MTTTSIFLSSTVSFFVTAALFFIYLIFHFLTKHQKNKLVAEGMSARNRLRKIGEKVTVMYDELEIKTRSWQQEVVVGTGTRSRNEYVDVNENYVYLRKLHNGHYFSQELVINMEPEILRMKLAYKNELSLYFNPNDFNDFFIDLEFLFQ